MVAANCGTRIAYLGFNRADHLCSLSLIIWFDCTSRHGTACEGCQPEDYQDEDVNPTRRVSVHVPPLRTHYMIPVKRDRGTTV